MIDQETIAIKDTRRGRSSSTKGGGDPPGEACQKKKGLVSPEPKGDQQSKDPVAKQEAAAEEWAE